jgi:uncharacterized membrane protein
MTRAPLVMYAVAGVAGAGGLVVLTRRAKSEGAVYAQRIGATMLLALAAILTVFASAMASWGAGA